MNNCKNIESNLIFYFYKEVNNVEMENIKNHLANCSNCEKLYENLSDSLSIIDNEKEIKVNPFIITRVNQEIEELKLDKSRSVVFQKFVQPAMAVAAVFVGILFGIFFGSFYNSENSYDTTANYESMEYYFNDIEQEAFVSYALSE